MEPITSDTILILAGSFLCVFLSLITVGGVFLFWRTQQQDRTAPPPQPPPVTRDVHAAPLAEMPTRNDANEQATQTTEPPTIKRPATRPVMLPPPEPTIDDETATRSRPVLRPLGIEQDDEFDEGGETTTRNLPRSGGFEPVVLPSPAENDTTPTVIIDRTQPMTDEDEEV